MTPLHDIAETAAALGQDGLAAQIREWAGEVERLNRENDHMRASLANGGGACSYCSLPKEGWSKCRSGFPGCARADDAMLCPHVGASLDAEVALEAAKQDTARLDRLDADDAAFFINVAWRLFDRDYTTSPSSL